MKRMNYVGIPYMSVLPKELCKITKSDEQSTCNRLLNNVSNANTIDSLYAPKSVRKELVKKALVLMFENQHKIDVQVKSFDFYEVLALIYAKLLEQYEKGEIEL